MSYRTISTISNEKFKKHLINLQKVPRRVLFLLPEFICTFAASCCTILLSCTHVVSCCLLFCSVVAMSDVTSGCTYVVLCCFMLLSRLDLSFQIKLHCFSELLRWLQKTALMVFKYYIFWSILNHILAKRQCREENLKAFSVPLKLYIITNGNMFINLFSVW